MLIKKGVLKNPRLIEAFRKVDRKWFVKNDEKDYAYIDEPLPIGEGQTISQPWTVAFMLELLDSKPGENIMEIGYGSGWVTALIVATGANVWAIERIQVLCEFGKKNIENVRSSVSNKDSLGYLAAKWGKVQFFCQDGVFGLPEVAKEHGGFDKIIASAALKLWTSDVHSLPQAWRDQLKVGGKIIAPIGHSIFEFTKKSEASPANSAGRFDSIEHLGFAFVPLVSDKI